jgi:hypothetical protein
MPRVVAADTAIPLMLNPRFRLILRGCLVYQGWRGRSDSGDADRSRRPRIKVFLGVACVCGQFSAVGVVLRLLSGEMAMGGVIICVRRVQYLFS